MYDLNSIPEIWNAEVKLEWLVEGMIPLGGVITLTGAAGSGKSSVALCLGHAVATGQPFLGQPTKQRKVLILDRENGLYVYSERFKRFALERTPDLNVWGLWNEECSPQDPDYPGLIAYVQQHEPLLIFDSLVAFHTDGSEQDATETRKFMQKMRDLTKHGATVILIHHTGKAESAQVYRGSSDIPAGSDTMWLLKQRKSLLASMTLKCTKSREGKIEETIAFGLDGEKFVPLDAAYIEEKDPAFLAVQKVVSENPGSNQSQIVKQLPEMPIQKVRKILLLGETLKKFRVEKGLKNASFYYACDTPEKP